jgi:very-short-patch-repair endonuclease
MGCQVAPDKIIAAIADRQYGVVGRSQLLAAGVTRDEIDKRVQRGLLRKMHRGVYALGHRALKPEAYWLAAVLACGEGAALSHATAAELWGIRPSASSFVDVVVPTRTGRAKREGIRLHTTKHPETTTHRGIPVTTPARTLLDLATMLPKPALERAVEEAEKQRLDCTGIERYAGRPGATKLFAELDRDHPNTRSEFERAFLTFCEDHGLPKPSTNSIVEGMQVDFHWASLDVVVEADSFGHHGTRQAFERDRQRDAILAAAGHRTGRYTVRQLRDRPDEVERALRGLGVAS